MSNREIADVFYTIADLLEVKGEVIYKILAYRKAADNLVNLSQDVEDLWKEGKLTTIPGVGKAIAEKIEEYLSTGKLEFLEKLKAEVPPSLVEVLRVPDVGPKKAALFWRELGITNMTELEAAARAGKLRTLPGMGEKSEARILAGVEAVSRRSTRIPLGMAWPFAMRILERLREVPGVVAAEAGGSLRRMRATVGDLDLLAAAADSGPVMDAFTSHPEVLKVLARGDTKASVEFRNGMRAQLWVHPPERFGTALVYGTGSKDHNVRLRELALKKKLSLSDQSFLKEDGSEILCATEEEVYEILGLPWIPPELREDRGEIKAARAGKLPRLIEVGDIRAALHAHSTWSDGKLSIKEMALAARERGMRLLAITDHSGSLGVAGGLSIEDLKKQRQEIDAVQKELGDSIILLQGSEVEIRANGSLDFPPEVLAELDIVIASLHTSLRQPRQQVTERLLNAIHSPHVDIIGHPTGRMIPNREGADLDMDAVFAAAVESGLSLEINAHPARLDLDDIHSRRAVELKVPLSINTDAHSAADLDLLHFGVATARRGWVEPQDVINTWEPYRILEWLRSRG
ncbi:MAG: DNA polymerase/3'-5' exonuclease PolX [Chloroflexi bacterium]|jgi:DNA polymerase (family 10)|nr:DNA polymerase/3'-5' exonuclease PolX [Chloroflexota bacterium]